MWEKIANSKLVGKLNGHEATLVILFMGMIILLISFKTQIDGWINTDLNLKHDVKVQKLIADTVKVERAHWFKLIRTIGHERDSLRNVIFTIYTGQHQIMPQGISTDSLEKSMKDTVIHN